MRGPVGWLFWKLWTGHLNEILDRGGTGEIGPMSAVIISVQRDHCEKYSSLIYRMKPSALYLKHGRIIWIVFKVRIAKGAKGLLKYLFYYWLGLLHIEFWIYVSYETDWVAKCLFSCILCQHGIEILHLKDISSYAGTNT